MRVPPWLALLSLGPLCGEIVSGHQAPLELCNPISVLFLMLPYGFGALLCRELVRRWGKGWLALLLLAAAYGVYEEAIVVRSVFNPDWLELDAFVKASFVLGVNWIYAIMLLHFHAIVSVGASVMLAEMIYPEQRRKPWLGKPGLWVCAVGLALWAPAGWWMMQYLPPWPGYFGSAFLIILFILAARYLPQPILFPRGEKSPQPWLFFGLGFVNMSLFFALCFYLPELWTPPLVLWLAGLIVLDVVTLGILLFWSCDGRAWDDLRRLGWVAGGLGFFILFDLIADFEEGFSGKSFTAFVAVLALILLVRRISHRGNASGLPASASSDPGR